MHGDVKKGGIFSSGQVSWSLSSMTKCLWLGGIIVSCLGPSQSVCGADYSSAFHQDPVKTWGMKTDPFQFPGNFFRMFSVSATDIKSSDIKLVNCCFLAVYCPKIKKKVTLGPLLCRFGSVKHKLYPIYLYLEIFIAHSSNFWILYLYSETQKQLYFFWGWSMPKSHFWHFCIQ